jgi:hypothetical protein
MLGTKERTSFMRNDIMTKGKFAKDFYILPTILIHNGDGIYTSIELAWLKWYIGIVITEK